MFKTDYYNYCCCEKVTTFLFLVDVVSSTDISPFQSLTKLSNSSSLLLLLLAERCGLLETGAAAGLIESDFFCRLAAGCFFLVVLAAPLVLLAESDCFGTISSEESSTQKLILLPMTVATCT